MNDNNDYNGIGPYCEGGTFNAIDPNIDPQTARNIANYYGAKGEAWSTGMARRLRLAANDNVPGKGRRVAA
ncbi:MULTISPECIES: hypothetical protein [unclassified Mesorhizobium]|uniref:hypothetical protein n=1 Tax=unclassified Mesorhizobium TaxID=325217 RepID=UPI001128F7BA|nr:MULTISPECIES: hypothetical protein [unclassified Mesorhizobium]TPJ86918.1 hypothetical protein FJ489_30660 [Mesorhizobium sp. B2-5-12]TPK19141.1 hypothetical protein FJ562_31065 [Mesorhizobium sp. B2-5-6]